MSRILADSYDETVMLIEDEEPFTPKIGEQYKPVTQLADNDILTISNVVPGAFYGRNPHIANHDIFIPNWQMNFCITLGLYEPF